MALLQLEHRDNYVEELRVPDKLLVLFLIRLIYFSEEVLFVFNYEI